MNSLFSISDDIITECKFIFTGIAYYIFTTEEETTVALLNWMLAPFHVEYKMWQTIIV